MKQLFLENSKLSMARVLSLVTVLSGVTIGLILAITGKLDSNGVMLSIGLVTAGIAGKIAQKKMEAK